MMAFDFAVRSVMALGMSLVGVSARTEVSKLLIALPTAENAAVKVERSLWTSVGDGAAKVATPNRAKGNMLETSIVYGE